MDDLTEWMDAKYENHQSAIAQVDDWQLYFKYGIKNIEQAISEHNNHQPS